jgi:hypothetical protein
MMINNRGTSMNRFYKGAAITTFLFVFYSASMASAQEYEIRLSREYKVGDKYRFLANGRHAEKMVVSIGNTPVNQKLDEFTVDLVSLMIVLEVGELGRVTKFAMHIERCLVTVGGVSKPLLSPGVVVNGAAENNRNVLTIDNAPVDAITAKILQALIPSHRSGISDDDVFGTREKKRVGDTWDIDFDVAKKSLKEMFNMQGDIKATTTLDGVIKGGDGDFLIISAWLDMDNVSMPLPDGVKIQSGQVKGTFSGRFPINQELHRLSQSMKMAAWFAGRRAPDPKTPEMIFQGAMERSLSRELESVK